MRESKRRKMFIYTYIVFTVISNAGRPFGEIEEEEQKPVSEARERFEPARAPGVKTAPWKPQGGAPPAKVSKIQKPVEAPKPKKFIEQVEMQVDEKPKQYPEFQKRIPLFGIPVEEEVKGVQKPEEKKTTTTEMRLPRFGIPVETPPPSKQTIVMKERPKFTKVIEIFFFRLNGLYHRRGIFFR